MGDSLDNIWQIKKQSANESDANEFKIELARKLLEEATGFEGEIIHMDITIKKEPTFNFNFKKLLTLKGNYDQE